MEHKPVDKVDHDQGILLLIGSFFAHQYCPPFKANGAWIIAKTKNALEKIHLS